jgi:hypothetical protein
MRAATRRVRVFLICLQEHHERFLMPQKNLHFAASCSKYASMASIYRIPPIFFSIPCKIARTFYDLSSSFFISSFDIFFSSSRPSASPRFGLAHALSLSLSLPLTFSALESRILATLLNEMDGVEAAHGVLVVGATNRPELLDAALMRPGRFDVLLHVRGVIGGGGDGDFQLWGCVLAGESLLWGCALGWRFSVPCLFCHARDILHVLVQVGSCACTRSGYAKHSFV